MYKKSLIFFSLLIIFLPLFVSGRNVEFQLNVEDRYYNAYEEIPAEVFITNYELSSKNITLVVEVGNRKFKYEYYNVIPNKQIKEKILLPQQIPGRQIVKARIYYDDNLNNSITEMVPDDIEILFPQEIKSYPKRMVIATFELPQNMYGGKSSIVKSDIINEGDFETKILVELGSNDEFQSQEITLKPGETKTVNLNVTFYSTGISFLESRIFYLEDDHKYLINFFAKESIVTHEKIADLKFKNMDLYLESNKEVNQNDEVKLKVNIINDGKFPAFNASGYLTATVSGLTITKNKVNYDMISPQMITGGKTADDYFEIKTANAQVQDASFTLSLNYIDNENRTREYTIPFTIFEGDDKCLMNWDCKEGFFCSAEGICQELICDCGEKTEHRCINPQDSKCPVNKKCNYYGVCENIPCTCGELLGHKCVLPDDNKCNDIQRCNVEGRCEDISCPNGEIKNHMCDYKCHNDNECGSNEFCNQYGRCDEVPCFCGDSKDHKCYKYACCSNLDCQNDEEVCGEQSHKCEMPSLLNKDVLIITMGSKLDKTDKYNQVIKEYQNVILDEGLDSFYIELDSPKLKKYFNVELTNKEDWNEIRNIIKKMAEKTNAKYLLILGGDGVVPQPLADTTAKIPEIPTSDDRYVDLDFNNIPDISVGRIATPSGSTSSELIVKALNSAIAMHKKDSFSKVILADTCIFPPGCSGINDVNYISQIFFNKNCSEADKCKSAKPYCISFGCDKKDEFIFELLNNDIIHNDGHGNPYGFYASPASGPQFTIFTSDILYNKPFNTNPIYTTAACHSGTIDCAEYGCIPKTGSVFSFLSNGASAYIGSTRYGYSSTSLIIGDMYKESENGVSIGESLLKAKQSRLKESSSEMSKAIIFELQLYGDPTLKIN